MQAILYFISYWWLLGCFVYMPERTTERMLIMAMVNACSGGLLLFYFIPRWRREDEATEDE